MCDLNKVRIEIICVYFKVGYNILKVYIREFDSSRMIKVCMVGCLFCYIMESLDWKVYVFNRVLFYIIVDL